MNLLSLTMLFPLLGFIILSFSQGKLSKNISAMIGVGSIGISVCVVIYVIIDFICNVSYNCNTFVFVQNLWTWFSINDLHVVMSLRLDGLSLSMLSMIIGIGLIIHIYAAWYMYEYEGYSRFFAYTNLFMCNMILLILSDNLLLMYFGWEGVGLCSYLLIGFYYFNVKNGMAAFKAFVMTKFGDVCLICALFMIYDQYHTLSISNLLALQQHNLYCVSNNVVWISFMLLIGAIAKSAQFPLQTWLTSAMVGPTPVSALIHAATMVTSGVYLIIRMNNFFLMTPNILYLVGIIGAITLILSSISALLQSDIKKILAYSTVSQIGYMFLALGGGHWVVAVFHLIVHSFFKALLFLAAGSLIYICSKENNIFKMGLLYKSAPLIYVCFLIGGASLSAFPIITAGFYSKELILLTTLVNHNYFFWISGLIGAFLTPVYMFRMIFVIFHGKKKIDSSVYNNNFCQNFPLIVLIILSTCVGGWIRFPLFNVFSDTINTCDDYEKIYFEMISGFLVIFGIWISSYFWLNTSHCIKELDKNNFLKTVIMRYMILLCYYGWGIDKIYRIIFVKPYLFIVNKLFYYNPIDIFLKIIIFQFYWMKYILKYSMNGKLNWYITSIYIGVVSILIIILSYIHM